MLVPNCCQFFFLLCIFEQIFSKGLYTARATFSVLLIYMFEIKISSSTLFFKYQFLKFFKFYNDWMKFNESQKEPKMFEWHPCSKYVRTFPIASPQRFYIFSLKVGNFQFEQSQVVCKDTNIAIFASKFWFVFSIMSSKISSK